MGSDCRRKCLAAAVVLVCGLPHVGCINLFAPKEPYPHPYTAHRKLPFSVDSDSDPAPQLRDSLRLGVCDLQSQSVCPAGGYYVNGDLKRLLLEPAALERQLADVIFAQLRASGVDAGRLRGETGNSVLVRFEDRRELDLLLKGTILRLEFSQHGHRKKPYDFLYLTVRFVLDSAADGETVWQRVVTAWRKLPPDPESSPQVLAEQATRALVHRLMQSESFRNVLQGVKGAS